MGRDKATLERPDGRRQLDHLISLLQTVGTDVIVSANHPISLPPEVPILKDLRPGGGPLAALESFHAAHPEDPVLLIGCDLFLLDAPTLKTLIDSYEDPATAFRNRLDQRGEPLAAIYAPAALDRVPLLLDHQSFCARHFLESLNPLLLDLPHPVALDNANTPVELDEVFAKITSGVHPKTVKILYFAKLREARGLDEEILETVACTVGGLYEELRFQHRLPLAWNALRAARNGDFCDGSTRLAPDDEIVFIPPVAGG